MRRFRLLLALPLLAGSLFAQSSWRLELTSGPVQLYPNAATLAAEGAPAPAEIVSGKYYRLIHLAGPAASQAQARLRAEGIELLDYYPHNCWVAAIPQSWDRSRASQLGLDGAYALDYRWKLHPQLWNRPLPAHAVPAPGMADVLVSWHHNLEEAAVRAALAAAGYEVLAEQPYPQVVAVRLPDTGIEGLAAQPYVLALEPMMPPSVAENYTGRVLHHSAMIASEHPMGRQYNGSGVVVAMGDDGEIGPHIDYQGRTDQTVAGASSGNHGDHVAGTIMGSGNLNPKHRGMAWGAMLKVYNVWDAVNNSYTHNQSFNVMITSTSYSNGCNAGYTSFARSADQWTRMRPSLLHVFSAGNDGSTDCGYGAGNLWGNITGGVKVGKNVVTVGNVGANDALAISSSRGPAADGRIFPHVCAKGTDVTSTIDPYTYASFTGTSMSCPGTSGTIAQLYQAYRELNNGNNPPSSLIKAALMNGADDLGNAGPDFKFGYGRINALRAVKYLEDNRYQLDTLSQGDSLDFPVTVPAGLSEFRAMLYWHDFEGSVNASPCLVNNLDFVVIGPGGTRYQPWVLNPAPNATTLNAPAVRGTDNLNNQEQVTLNQPAAGNYTLRVKGSTVPQANQAFVVVWEMQDSSITVVYPNGGEKVAPGESEKIRWDAVGNSGTFTVEYSLDSGATWQLGASGIAGDRRYWDWSIPSGTQSAGWMVRVSRGAVSDVSDYPANIMRVPANLNVYRVCPTNLTLRWDSIPTAASYIVYRLGTTYMDSIGTTTNRSFVVNGTSPTAEYWFGVSAVGTDNARGRRSLSIRFLGNGLSNCQEPDDVGVNRVTAPGNGAIPLCGGSGSLPLKVELRSFSPNTITSVPVTVVVDGGSPITETFTGTLNPYGTAIYTFTSPLSLGVGPHTIRSWTGFAPDTYALNDSSGADFEIFSAPLIASLPYTQDFEGLTNCATSGNCAGTVCNVGPDFYNATNGAADDIDWRTDAGGTPTADTGPDQDYNPGTATGKYLYLEASSCAGREAQLISPCIDLNQATVKEVTFAFHLYGAEMGALHVDLFYDGEWHNDITPVMSTDWSNRWWQRTLNLNNYANKIVNVRWRGITGAGSLSDMALDDITFDRLAVNRPETSSQNLQVFPNPGNGEFRILADGLSAPDLEISFTDMQGRECYRQSARTQAGAWHGDVDVRNLPAGMYLLRLRNGDQLLTQRVSIQ